MAKPSPQELSKLAYKFVYLAGGPRNGVSIYDVASPQVYAALGFKPISSNSKAAFKDNFRALQAWMDANHPKCPTKHPVGHKAERSKKKTPKARKLAAPNQATVTNFIKRSSVDPKRGEFLQSFEWRAVRMMAIKKYGATCQCCGASPATGAVINVDHIKSRKFYPELALDINNLQILCADCNHGKGNWDMTDWRMDRLENAEMLRQLGMH